MKRSTLGLTLSLILTLPTLANAQSANPVTNFSPVMETNWEVPEFSPEHSSKMRHTIELISQGQISKAIKILELLMDQLHIPRTSNGNPKLRTPGSKSQFRRNFNFPISFHYSSEFLLS